MSDINQMVAQMRRRTSRAYMLKSAMGCDVDTLVLISNMRPRCKRDIEARLLWRVHRDTKVHSRQRAHEIRQAKADANVISGV